MWVGVWIPLYTSPTKTGEAPLGMTEPAYLFMFVQIRHFACSQIRIPIADTSSGPEVR